MVFALEERLTLSMGIVLIRVFRVLLLKLIGK